MSAIAKAIAAFVTSGLTAAFAGHLLPDALNTPDFIAGVTAVVAGLVTWLVPNKAPAA